MKTETLYSSTDNDRANKLDEQMDQAIALTVPEDTPIVEPVAAERAITDTAIEEKLPLWKRRAVKVLGVVAGSAAGVVGISQYNAAPTFSSDQHTIRVTTGDTVWEMADLVEGVENINKQDAVSEIYDRSPDYDDGVLNPGDELNIPVSVEK